MLEVKKRWAKVVRVAPRIEKHGDEDVLAVDVGLRIDVPAAWLEQFATGLTSALYRKAGDETGEQLEISPAELTMQRFPLIDFFHWDDTSACALILHGAKKEENVGLSGEATGWSLKCHDGGTVEVAVKVRALASADVVGELTAYLGEKAQVSLTAPAKPAAE